jgi:hypothetical protein
MAKQDDVHDATDSADLVGQPSGAYSLALCGAGEGKAWKGDRMRYPNAEREKHERLTVPKVEGDANGVYLDHAIVYGPRGGKRKVLVGITFAHEHGLAKGNLAKAYAEFAATCADPEIARYAKVQAMAKSPQLDGRGNQFAAYRDRPRKQHDPRRGEPGAPPEGGPTMVCEEYVPMHGQDCMCFECLVKR